MIRITMDQSPSVSANDVRQAVQDWATDHDRVGIPGDRVLAEVPLPEDTSTVVWRMELWFALDTSKTTLLNGFEDLLQQYVPWYEIQYHGCTHDGTTGPCSWDDARTWGPVPEVNL